MLVALKALLVAHPTIWAISITSCGFTFLGLVAFNLGYVWLYLAFLPLLCVSSCLSAEVHVDLFLALLLFAVASSLLYAVGIFALPVVAGGVVLSLPVLLIFQRWGIVALAETTEQHYQHHWGRKLDLCELLLIALFARYVLYRSVGGAIPLRIGELESLTRFLISEVGGWGVFALGYGMQFRARYGTLPPDEAEFVTSLPLFIGDGTVFGLSPCRHYDSWAQYFGGSRDCMGGFFLLEAAHILMRTLTLRRLAMEGQNQRLQLMNTELARNERLAAVGEMSSAISHQLLQKVGLVGLQSSLLRDVLLDDAMAMEERLHESRERVEQLDESIADLNTTLSDLLIFSKDVALHLNPYLLCPLLREAVEEVSAVSKPRKVFVAFHGAHEDTLAIIDRIKLKQALLNLLTNAIEASPSPWAG